MLEDRVKLKWWNPTNVSPETSPLNITETINFFDGNDFDYNTDKSNI